MEKQLPEVDDKVREKAAKNCQVTILPDGMLDWSNSVRFFGMDEYERQEIFNKECNRLVKTNQ